MMILSIKYIPKYDKAAAKSVVIIKGINPSWEALKGRFKHPVPSAEANIAKVDPLILPFLMGRYGPWIEGRFTWSSECTIASSSWF